MHSRLSDYGGTCWTVTGGRNTRGRAGAAEEKGERDWEQGLLRPMLEMGEMLRAVGGRWVSPPPAEPHMHIASVSVRRWVIHLPPADMLSPQILQDEASFIYSLLLILS